MGQFRVRGWLDERIDVTFFEDLWSVSSVRLARIVLWQ